MFLEGSEISCHDLGTLYTMESNENRFKGVLTPRLEG